MTGITVRLSREDFFAAWTVGTARHRHHCERKRRPVTERGLAEEGAGAVAEFAVARLMGGQWNAEIGAAHYGSDDVVDRCGGAVEVKATEWKTGRLLIYERTADTLPVVLAIVDRLNSEVRIAGWITAADGKRAEWWEQSFKIPCWAVPQSHLRPIEELPCFSPPTSPPSFTPQQQADWRPTTSSSESDPNES